MTLTGVVHEAVQIVRPCKGCKKPMINPHKLKVYCTDACMRKHKRRKTIPNKCENCGSYITGCLRGAPKWCVTIKCQEARREHLRQVAREWHQANYTPRRPEDRPVRPSRPCGWCKKSMTNPHNLQKYCQDKCRDKAKNKRKASEKPPRICENPKCRRVITDNSPSGRARKWCQRVKCQEHKQEQWRKLQREWQVQQTELDNLAPKTTRRCEYCDGQIPYEKPMHTKYCCGECSYLSRYKRKTAVAA